jgi:predicted transcriptional regulator
MSRQQLAQALGHAGISGRLKRVVQHLLKDQLIERTLPGSANNPKQQLKMTPEGKQFLELLEQAKKKK